MKKLLLWIKASRALYSITVLFPCCIGALIAWYHGAPFQAGLLGLVLAGMLFANIGTNFTNDYFDWKSGVDKIDEGRKFKPGAEVLMDGGPSSGDSPGGPPPHSTSFFSPRTVLLSAVLSFVATSTVGLILVFFHDWRIMLVGVAGILLGWFYTAPPVKLGYRGFGDLVCFLGSGPFPVVGTYFLFTGRISLAAILAGCFVGLLVDAILYIGNVIDAEADRKVGKITLSTLLGKKCVRVLAPAYYLLAFALLAASIVAGLFPVWTIAALLALPLAARIVMVTRSSYEDIPRYAPAIMMTVRCFSLATILLGLGFALGRIIA
jgi:1,4-dihydroxy-2-naphthoate octaprenyltransferase